MTFISTGLPNGGSTGHFAISYDDALSVANGRDLARDFMSHCEADLQQVAGWFAGVNFQFAFPLNVQITGEFGGASWLDPPDSALPFGYHPTVTVMPGSHPTTSLIRYLLVAEVTEMYMASQRREWSEPTDLFHGSDEGSMGESLSRFLASQFISTNRLGTTIFPGFHVASDWLNDFGRPNFVDTAIDDTQPDTVTGCGTNFLFYLHDQLGFSIQQIIAAAGPNLGRVHLNLTGKADGWSAFKGLVDLHYPLDGTNYSPPLDNVFRVADLDSFGAPDEVSWVVNKTPNVGWLSLSHLISVKVKVSLSTDDPSVLSVPASILVDGTATVDLHVPPQGMAFTSKVVHVTATYAGKQKTIAVNVVRPEGLHVPPLEIAPLNQDACAQQFVAGARQEFGVKNLNVMADQSGLVYNWFVSGAVAQATNTPTLTIPVLPPPGTPVTIKVTVTNARNIHGEGTLKFTTAQEQTGLLAELRKMSCRLRDLKAVNAHVPPWEPMQVHGEIIVDVEQLVNIAAQSRRVAQAAERVSVAVESVLAARNGG